MKRKTITILELLHILSDHYKDMTIFLPIKIKYRNVILEYNSAFDDYLPCKKSLEFKGDCLLHYLFENEHKMFLNENIEIVKKIKIKK